jgi:PLP dependent protein
MSQLADNLAQIRRRIAEAAARSGRAAESVTLVAVTKSASAAQARELALAGCTDLGEGRPQELWSKAAALSDLPVRWHLIGHLQRNKVERTLPLVSMIHSVDSLRLLQALDAAAESLGRTTPVLLEVNISGDAAKHGFAPAEMSERLAGISAFTRVQIRGLMAMAGLDGDADRARVDFRNLRQLRDQLREFPGGANFSELSMGMSGDFEAAVEEGATIVRIGSALFDA